MAIPASRFLSSLTLAALVWPLELFAQPYPLDSAEFQVNTYTTNGQAAESLAIVPGGGFVVTWISNGSSGSDTSGYSIQLRRFDSRGLPLDPDDRQVNTETGSHQRHSRVATDAEGNFVVVWQSASCSGDSDPYCIHLRRFAADGTPLDPADVQANVLTVDSQRRPAVAMNPDGSFIVVWDSYSSFGTDTSGTSIQARRFRADGMPLDPTEFQVNTYTTQFQRRPAVAVTPAGDFVVVWDSVFTPTDYDYGVEARRFHADGTPVDGNEIRVNTYTSGFQGRPTVAPEPGGGVVVAWESDGSAGGDSSLLSVQARRFDENGSPLDPTEFQVNTYTTSYQYDARIAANAEGDFIVVWTSFGSAGTDLDNGSVQARRFRANGSAVDASEYQANTITSGLQGDPAVGSDLDGDFVVAWSSATSVGSDTDDFSVQARRFGRPKIEVTSTSGGIGGPDCTLRDAITAANTGSATGACPAGNEGGVIELPAASDIALTAPDNGSNGLPVVVRPVTILGHGSRIERDPGLACPAGAEFRPFEVGDGGILELENVSVSNGCLSLSAGGGVLASGGTLILRRASIEGNETGFDGGGVAVAGGHLIAYDSSVRGNLAGGAGGGVAISGDPGWLLLERTTVSGNGAATGGGLSLAGSGGGAPLLARNSTFSGNDASVGGGGIELSGVSPALTLDFSSVVGNDSPSGSGAWVVSGVLSLHGSLVGDGSGGADCASGAGSVGASGANLDTDGSCAALAGGSVTTVPSLGLGPLADHGGWVRTHLPLAGSPALDAAPACAFESGAPLVEDARGYPRPTDDDGDTVPACELGSVERGPIFLDGFETADAGRWSSARP